jgi:hypothetical protein
LNATRYGFDQLDDLLDKNGFEILETRKLFQGMHAYFMAGKKNGVDK